MDATPENPSTLTPAVAGLLEAYRLGAFPMADPGTDEVGWYRPDRRAIFGLPRRPLLEPGADDSSVFHVPASLRRTIKRAPFRLTTDGAFERVMRECAAPRAGREETWINEGMIALYTLAHRDGVAHSVEAWADACGRATLVGGVYGIALGGAFFAESKFSRPELGGTDASKVCLAALVDHLSARGFVLLDVQFVNPHLEQFNCREVPLEGFLVRLREAEKLRPAWTPFEPFAPRV